LRVKSGASISAEARMRSRRPARTPRGRRHPAPTARDVDVLIRRLRDQFIETDRVQQAAPPREVAVSPTSETTARPSSAWHWWFRGKGNVEHQVGSAVHRQVLRNGLDPSTRRRSLAIHDERSA
jgi:hypothetical protein